MKSAFSSTAAIGFALIASATALGIAGTDLVLPAVPSLPEVLGGTPARAQLVLAAYVAGTALGLLFFGAVSAYADPRKAVVASLALYALISLAAVFIRTLDELIVLRFVQGAAGAAPAVFAPGFIRALFPEGRALRMLGLLGSIESLVPALAPIAGAWLLIRFGWRASFIVIGALSLALAALLGLVARRLPHIATQATGGSYAALLGDPVYLRYALSQAFSLGGLLVFVFGAPAVIVGPMGGALSDFILLQITGIVFFILGANLTGRLVERFGHDPLILFGTALSALGALSILGYALLGGDKPLMLLPLSIVLNLGFGLRGPPGFLQAVLAAGGDDARGAALVILAILLTVAGGTALAAPSVASGLLGVAMVASAISVGAVLCLLVLRRPDCAAKGSHQGFG
ncbi:MFS transporter [Methylocapsa sp. S129]|uniref:MFS transporter n=1 Tax=Methylocapsa sp. S129 TaxID=1641869 RepID=UPI00131C7C54|nr:MFS transporter [Methylocapsa sp. S129]